MLYGRKKWQDDHDDVLRKRFGSVGLANRADFFRQIFLSKETRC
jgi:hypothetical protein